MIMEKSSKDCRKDKEEDRTTSGRRTANSVRETSTHAHESGRTMHQGHKLSWKGSASLQNFERSFSE